jgi:hypothetical protein
MVMHPLKMSVADIVYKEKKLHLKFKFFTDDFEFILGQFCKKPIDIFNKAIDTALEKNIQKYINGNFAMYTNNVLVKFVYKKSYMNESKEVVYVEYEAQPANIDKVKTVKIKDMLFFEGIPEQKNVANVNLFGEIKVLTFNNDPEEYTRSINY